MKCLVLKGTGQEMNLLDRMNLMNRLNLKDRIEVVKLKNIMRLTWFTIVSIKIRWLI